MVPVITENATKPPTLKSTMRRTAPPPFSVAAASFDEIVDIPEEASPSTPAGPVCVSAISAAANVVADVLPLPRLIGCVIPASASAGTSGGGDDGDDGVRGGAGGCMRGAGWKLPAPCESVSVGGDGSVCGQNEGNGVGNIGVVGSIRRRGGNLDDGCGRHGSSAGSDIDGGAGAGGGSECGGIEGRNATIRDGTGVCGCATGGAMGDSNGVRSKEEGKSTDGTGGV